MSTGKVRFHEVKDRWGLAPARRPANTSNKRLLGSTSYASPQALVLPPLRRLCLLVLLSGV